MLNSLSRVELEKLFSSGFVKNENLNPLYSLYSIDFYQELYGDSWKNYSSVCFVEERPVALLITFISHEASYFSMPGMIICDHEYKNADIFANSIVDKLILDSKGLNIKLIKLCSNFDLIIDSSHKQFLKNAYVDLSNSESIIRSSVRKSYKSLINWGLRNLDIKIHNSKNITLHKFNEIKMFHLLVAKKKTRSDKSWDIQYDMIKSAHGFIVEAHYMRQLASASIIIHNSNEAFYGVSINSEDLMREKLPINHLVLYKSIIESKSIGLTKFNFGDTSTSTDSKINNINTFKNGFARQTENKLTYEIYL